MCINEDGLGDLLYFSYLFDTEGDLIIHFIVQIIGQPIIPIIYLTPSDYQCFIVALSFQYWVILKVFRSYLI